MQTVPLPYIVCTCFLDFSPVWLPLMPSQRILKLPLCEQDAKCRFLCWDGESVMKKKMILNVISPCSIILFYTTFIQDIFSSEKGGQRALLMISCIPIRYKNIRACSSGQWCEYYFFFYMGSIILCSASALYTMYIVLGWFIWTAYAMLTLALHMLTLVC